ncbi:MAG: M23 family metallopeptidase [Verrucomicrobiae bacterium]|nr:M23 family metallopeptidase [Verrucomicrobiae bacterium]
MLPDATHASPFPRRPESMPPRASGTLTGLIVAVLLVLPLDGGADTALDRPFRLPTDNRAIFEPGGEPRFYAPTPGRTWTAGGFGCVRSEGMQMHEGIDILFVQRDRRGEPLDEVRASAPGRIAYISRQASLSNYGIYVVVAHRIEGLEVFTLYAHLRDVRPELAPGMQVAAGQVLGIMGRTANTATPIARDRAHLHFEINLFVNDGFAEYLQKHSPGSRNDHGPWNGRNLVGLDPAAILLAQRREGASFSLLAHVRNQAEYCRVLLAATDFPWLRRYPMLIRRNPAAEAEGIVAYEASLNYNGVPFRLTPRARSEIEGPVSNRLLRVNESEALQHRCRQLIFKRGQAWVLTARGEEWLRHLVHR